MTSTLVRTVAAALACAALASLTACGLSKPYPAKSFFTIDVPPPETAPSAGSGALRVGNARIARPFDEREFQYRTAASQFQSDYYVNFITDPAAIVTGSLIEWFSSDGTFAVVVDASSQAEADWTLEARVSALYGDYRDGSAPRAVVRAHFFLLDESSADARVIFNREYSAEEAMSGPEPAALVEAWGRALGRMYEELASDIAARDERTLDGIGYADGSPSNPFGKSACLPSIARQTRVADRHAHALRAGARGGTGVEGDVMRTLRDIGIAGARAWGVAALALVGVAAGMGASIGAIDREAPVPIVAMGEIPEAVAETEPAAAPAEPRPLRLHGVVFGSPPIANIDGRIVKSGQSFAVDGTTYTVRSIEMKSVTLLVQPGDEELVLRLRSSQVARR